VPENVAKAGAQFSQPVKLHSLALPLALWQQLTGNDRKSVEMNLPLTDPPARDFRPAPAAPVPKGLTLNAILESLPPAVWAPAPWSTDAILPAGPHFPFSQSQ
jgi:hypothetical protein